MIKRISHGSTARIPLYVITWKRHEKNGGNASCARRLLDIGRKTSIKSRLLLEPDGWPILMNGAVEIGKQKNDGMTPTPRKPGHGRKNTCPKIASQPRSDRLNGERRILNASRNYLGYRVSNARNDGKSFWRGNERDITRTQQGSWNSNKPTGLIHHSCQSLGLIIANTGSCILSSSLSRTRPERRQGLMQPRSGATSTRWRSSIREPASLRSTQASSTKSTTSCRFVQSTSAVCMSHKISKS